MTLYALYRIAIRGVTGLAALVLIALVPCSAPLASWQAYTFRDGAFRSIVLSTRQALDSLHSCSPGDSRLPADRPSVPPTWRVTASVLADVTGDHLPEWALVVWRPWRDWPTQRWSDLPSPIAEFHDAAGESCHLILLDPHDGHQIWAGSALPAPLLALVVGDVDGDQHDEVVALEGNYSIGRDGPAARVNVWGWNGFGFTLEWRSPPGVFRQLCLTDVNGDGILDPVVR